MLNLDHKVEVVVPSDYNGKVLDATAEAEAIAQTLAREFGGATSTQAVGYWVSETLGLVRENVRIVWAYSVEPIDTEWLLAQAESWKAHWSQEAVLVTVDGRGILV